MSKRGCGRDTGAGVGNEVSMLYSGHMTERRHIGTQEIPTDTKALAPCLSVKGGEDTEDSDKTL